ncbi:hypothetical protein V499_05449, partial [Pseudogymnoascus sp. VKM F-103]
GGGGAGGGGMMTTTAMPASERVSASVTPDADEEVGDEAAIGHGEADPDILTATKTDSREITETKIITETAVVTETLIVTELTTVSYTDVWGHERKGVMKEDL